jgi:FixJ family two-component response regulator
MNVEPEHQPPLVVVVDDDASMRASLANLFQSVGLQVRTFASASEILTAKKWEAPSCIVLDIRLPGLSGLDLQAEFTRLHIDAPIVFMTGHGDIPMTVRAMKAGAVEFLTKPFREQDMLDAVQAGIVKSSNQRALDDAATRLRSTFGALTTREQEVMELVTSGLMNKQVAVKMGVSEITVKVHRANVMHKMGAKSLADLVRMAEALGIRAALP